MKYYIIAGEKSGDLHASNLIQELKKLDKKAEFRGFGGEKMQEAGLDLQVHYQEMAFMGFLEVIKHLPTIRKYLRQCKKDILAWQPDAVILVDYAGFNLRIAKFAKKKKFKTLYYISPKVWAWNTGRAKKIRKIIDKMFVILHFEKAFYKKYNYEVEYVGNPLFDEISKYEADPEFLTRNHLSKRTMIAVLPGSRAQEVQNTLETMLSIAKDFQDCQWFVAGVTSLPEELYEPARILNIPVLYDQTYDLLHHADAALVTSGTATLETALFEVPQVVCYRTSSFSYFIARFLIKVPFISLVNLLAGKKVVRELIQNDFNTFNLQTELTSILNEKREGIKKEYKELKEKISTEGTSLTTAKLMLKEMKRKT